jgi:hypothetical protein
MKHRCAPAWPLAPLTRAAGAVERRIKHTAGVGAVDLDALLLKHVVQVLPDGTRAAIPVAAGGGEGVADAAEVLELPVGEAAHGALRQAHLRLRGQRRGEEREGDGQREA